MKKLSEDYKKGFNDALEKALEHAKLVYHPAGVIWGDRQSFELYYELKDRFNAYGTVYIDKQSIMRLRKR